MTACSALSNRPLAKPVLPTPVLPTKTTLVARPIKSSSASQENVELFLEASGTRELFRSVLTGDSVAAAKPAPDIYLASLERLRVRAGQALVLEDALSGIRAARAAGIRVVAVAGTFSAQQLAREDVLAVVSRVVDLEPSREEDR